MEQELLNRALCYAAEKHSGQTRKMSRLPYILHPMEAAAIVGTMTDDPEVLAAAVLHDTVEDTDATAEEIGRLFGPRVARLVASETEKKRHDRPAAETWKLRKAESLAELAQTDDPAVKMLWLGDKLSNMRSIYQNYRRVGAEFWTHLHQSDPAEQEWYYRTIADSLSDLREFDAYGEYCRLLDLMFDGGGERVPREE